MADNPDNSSETKSGIDRRSFMGRMAALGFTGIAGSSWAMTSDGPRTFVAQPDEIVIRNGYILAMDPQVGDYPVGDVHISQGQIVSVGENLEVPAGAEEVDATGKFVLPGFVETHWHIWNSLMRSLIGNKPGVGYFEMKDIIGPHYRPRDTYAATRFAVAEALHSGITTLHDWSHNVRGPEYAVASLQALNEMYIRGRFSQGPSAAAGPDIDLELLQNLHQSWSQYSNKGLLHLGLAWEGYTGRKSRRIKEVEHARDMQLPISVHADTITEYDDLIKSDFQVIHAMKASEGQFEKLANMRASVSSSPFSEMRIGYGLPPVNKMLPSGVCIGLSVDTTPLSGNADMFALMKIFLNLSTGMAQDQFKVSPRRILEIATIEGARSLGLGDVTGSISPGKRADIQVVAIDDINMGVLSDPANLLVLSAQPGNVDTVLVDGKFRKRNGKLVNIDTQEVISQAAESLSYLLDQSGW